MRMTRLGLALLLAGCGVLISCTARHSAPPAEPREAARLARPVPRIEPPTMEDDAPREYAGLHNVVAYHEGYLSGSVPEGEAGFDTLAGPGVRTIISVDGALPDVAAARARGMRYIHLPIGYNGFDEQRKLQLVRATRDALHDGPVYIHCHHGRHRSAGAAGTVIASLGWASPDGMIARMKVSGTSPEYRGLYACTASAVVLDERVINAVPADFPEVARPSGFVKGMVDIDAAYEHLKLIQKAGWRVPPNHPDLVPAAEAGRMADLFRVLIEQDRAMQRDRTAEFEAMMHENGLHASVLEEMLLAGERDAERLSEQFARVSRSCKDCHVVYRD